jgi:hypothetical protein
VSTIEPLAMGSAMTTVRHRQLVALIGVDVVIAGVAPRWDHFGVFAMCHWKLVPQCWPSEPTYSFGGFKAILILSTQMPLPTRCGMRSLQRSW